MKKYWGLLLILFVVSAAWGQNKNNRNILQGMVVDGSDGLPVMQATVQALSPKDSVMVVGNVTNQDGMFSLFVMPGKYILKISYIGYKPVYKDVVADRTRHSINLGRFELKADAIMLEEAVVVAQAPEVTAAGDTLVYNSSAYRMPEGSALEELVKKLPGAEVDENGKITINGKEVKKIMVDGKEFFANNPQMAMKNLPVSIIDQVRAYDKKSDMARLTGVDDGEEETVLDLSVKKGMNKGWFGNLDLSGGTEKRYNEKLFVNNFRDQDQFTLMGSINNVNDESYPGGGGGRHHRGPNGLNTIGRAGFNFSTSRKRWETGGSVEFNYQDEDLQSRSNSETFVSSDVSSFKRGINLSRNKTRQVDAEFRIEWKPDTLTTLIFRPKFNYGNERTASSNNGFTFKHFYDYTIEELLEAGDITNLVPAEDIINRTKRNRLGEKDRLNFGASLVANRKLGKPGRNITVNLRYGYGDTDSEQFNASTTEYYQRTPEERMEILNRYMDTPTMNYNYGARATYSEPLFKGGFLLFSYNFQKKVQESDNKTYDMPDDWQTADGYLPELAVLNPKLSKYARYTYYNHTMEATFRWLTKKQQLSLGVSVQPQRSSLNYYKGDFSTDTVRKVLNVTPTLEYRFMFGKTSSLRVTYRGYSSQPNMEKLLPIEDDTDPLHIKVGNPGLKPSFTNYMKVYYNLFKPKTQRGVMAYMQFQTVTNAISNRSIYDESTGGYTTTPENINGNWNIYGGLGTNTALRNKKFTINTYTMGRYNNIVSFMKNSGEAMAADKSKTKQLTMMERLRGTYRNNWFELSLNGSIYYTHSRNSMQEQSNMDTYNFSYGASTNINLPWNMVISTDISERSRRGYSDSNMNTDELVWNAQVSQNFLKNNAATVSVQFFDILRNQSNISRSISASMRQDTEYNSIYSYCMFHFVYRLNIFGDKGAKGKGGRRDAYGKGYGSRYGGGYGGGRYNR